MEEDQAAALRGGQRGALPPPAAAGAGQRRACRPSPACCPARRDVDRAAGRRRRSRGGRDGRRRLLHLRDVHLRADLPDLHHGLGRGPGAARCGGDAAHRRGALRPAVDRRAARPGAGGPLARRDRVPGADLLLPGPRPRAGAARHRPARPGRLDPRRRGAGGLGQDDARFASFPDSTRSKTACCFWTGSTSIASPLPRSAPTSPWCPRTPSCSR